MYALFPSDANKVTCVVTTYNDMGHLELDVRFPTSNHVDPAQLKTLSPHIKSAVYEAVAGNFTYFTKGRGTRFFTARRKQLLRSMSINGYKVNIAISCHSD